MIVRSISTPAQRRRRGTRRESPRGSTRRCGSASQLHDVGGVGAEHHQLAVRHVDDAHDAERDRQADRDQHQHRAQAQAEEQRLDAGVERCATIDRCASTSPRPPCARASSASAKRAVRRLLDQRRQPVAHIRAQRCRAASAIAASRVVGVGAVESRPAPGRSRSPSSRPRRFPMPARSRSSATLVLVERAQHFADGRQPHRRVRARPARSAPPRLRSTRRRRLLVPILRQLVARRRRRRLSASADR